MPPELQLRLQEDFADAIPGSILIFLGIAALGRGWRSSIRLALWVQIAYAAGAFLIDAVRGRPWGSTTSWCCEPDAILGRLAGWTGRVWENRWTTT